MVIRLGYKDNANREKCQISTSECIEKKTCIFYTERRRVMSVANFTTSSADTD